MRGFGATWNSVGIAAFYVGPRGIGRSSWLLTVRFGCTLSFNKLFDSQIPEPLPLFVQFLYLIRAHIHAFLCVGYLFLVESLDRITNGLGHEEEWGETDCCMAANLAVPVATRSRAARLLRSWVRIPPGHGCLSVVSVVCCQVEVSATN